MTALVALLSTLAFFAALGLTPCVRKYSLKTQMLDVPGERSSHSIPTPRGGGAAFVLPFVLAGAVVAGTGAVDRSLWVALLGGGAFVAAVGWIDDRKTLSSWLRLAFYAAASAWTVYWLGGLPVVELGIGVLRLGWAGYPLAWLIVFTFTNLYNFMDGIDGLATVEGVVALSAAGVLALACGDGNLALPCLALGAALLGFLPWNWEPARIFMGDIGSNFLGFSIASLAVAAQNRDAVPLPVWGILLAVFVVDSVATFAFRLMRGYPPHKAHREHAYQRAVQEGRSHRRVVASVLLLDLALVVGAYFAWRHLALLLPLLAVSLAGMSILWWRFAVASPARKTP